MINSITFWDRSRAASHLFVDTDCVVSICDPGATECDIHGTSQVMRMSFYDVIEPVRVDEITMYPMLKADAQAMIVQIEKWQNDNVPHNVIVHCEAGASRSAAIALYVYAYTGCKFPNLSWALYANTYMLEMFRQVSPMQLNHNWHMELLSEHI